MKRIFPLLLTIGIVALTSCANSQSDKPAQANATSEVKQAVKYDLSPQEFAEKMNKLPNAAVIDVRTPQEFAGGILNRAVNVDWRNSDFSSKINAYDKSEPIFVYCRSGARSHEAAEMMRKSGFSEVYELNGGVMKWEASGFVLQNEKNAAVGMSKTEYDKLLATDKPVLVDFYAPWCSPCMKMEPYLKEIADEMKGKVDVVRIDLDQNRPLGKEMGIVQLPALYLYQNGEIVWSKKSLAEKAELITAIESILK